MFVVDLDAGDRICEVAPLADGTQDPVLAITAGGYGTRTELVLESPGRMLLARGLEQGTEGRVVFELAAESEDLPSSLCFRNRGLEKVALAGERAAGSDVGKGEGIAARASRSMPSIQILPRGFARLRMPFELSVRRVVLPQGQQPVGW
ncbi:hypothetical protein LRS13_00900 [Svornostia abyssi]|uniref:Uncharacterized protein n=1 Tax=Svornostia abyssi TaxID=2898438 RepID=A0ABY5PHH4_9ACTN|nr:hypothetical protein LRS13_00900 [Parviterribacteraceae bacterium J379]